MDNIFVNTLILNNLSKYFKSSKSDKTKIIDNILTNAPLHRKSLIRRLNSHKKKTVNTRGGSKPKYLPETNDILKLVWASRDYICAELLHPYLIESIRYLNRYGELKSFLQQAISQVSSMPLGTLKWKLKSLDVIRPNFSYYRRSGEQLKKLVPISTEMNQSPNVGYLELDFVDHNGGDSGGQFCRTLCCADVFSQYLVRKATRGKAKEVVQATFNSVLKDIMFKIKALHTDNEKSLLKSLILQQARCKSINISRSRSYQKQDNGHVEQKNGDKIRLLVGYKRYDTNEQMRLLTLIYQHDDLLQNHFIPSRRLIEKLYDANGKLVSKKWDIARTPFQRILDDVSVDKKTKLKLMVLHIRLNPLELKQERDKFVRKLRNLSVTH